MSGRYRTCAQLARTAHDISLSLESNELLRRRLHMQFVLVNGRSPRPDSSCALCCETIGESYLRELTSHRPDHNYEWYLGYCKLSFAGRKKHARAS